MPQTAPRPGDWTVRDVLALPDDGQRHEVLDGVLYVTPAPRLVHQMAVELLGDRLKEHAELSGIGMLFRVPADLQLGHGALVQPDLFVAPFVEGRRPREWREITRLLLAVEVLSAVTASRDRGVKRRLYQRHADEYWIVDLDARLIERWRPDDERPEILDAVLTWQPAGTGAALSLDLSAFFRAAWDD